MALSDLIISLCGTSSTCLNQDFDALILSLFVVLHDLLLECIPFRPLEEEAMPLKFNLSFLLFSDFQYQ
jgi:hypothetical protein